MNCGIRRRRLLVHRAVKVIAWIYLACASAVGFRAAYATLFGGPGGDLGGAVLGLLLGSGLLRLHPLARSAALLVSGFALIGGTIAIALCIGHQTGWNVASGGLIVDQPTLAFGALGAWIAFAGWQVWVLTRPETIALFEGSRA
jgi:hypothetical protein